MSVQTMSSDYVRFVTKGVDLTAVALTTITPAPTSTRNFVVTRIDFIIATKTGTISGNTVLQVGNDSGKSNVVASAAVVPSSVAAGKGYAASVTMGNYDLSTANGAGGGLVMSVTTGAAGGGTLTADVHVVGYWTS